MVLETASIAANGERTWSDVDLSSRAFWSSGAEAREKNFAELRQRPGLSWHRPLEDPMYVDLTDVGFWAVLRHADLVEVTRRHDDFISGAGVVMDSMPQELLDAGQGFIAYDPPRHTSVRRLLASAFTPKQMRRISGLIEANAGRVVDSIAHKGEVEFVAEVAGLIPLHNICDMVGIPEHHRMSVLQEVELVAGWRDSPVMVGQDPMKRLYDGTVTMFNIADEVMTARRELPTDDLFSALLAAEVDGERLDDFDIASFFNLLMIAGGDTTRQATSHGLKALTDHPEQRDWLMQDLAGRLPIAVEEILRWSSPIRTLRRTAARDCEVASQAIKAGDPLILFYMSANADAEVFEGPERFDVTRAPNRHVAFGGGGIHHCLGNQLARTQLIATFTELLNRLPDIHVVGEPAYGTGTLSNAVLSMQVRFTPEAAR